MWLIHTESLKLEYFVGNDIPEYAILSHTWGDGEVTFQDWQDFRKASKKTGFAKIKSACALAQADKLNYIWVDTNCIDKTSSAELSEAINSMFAWYQNSEICYVYLADVKDPDDVARMLGDVEDIKKARFIDSLRNSRWFTRGWTLQELLAPWSIRFLTQDWKPISMELQPKTWLKYHQEPLLRLVSDISGIRFDAISYPNDVMSCSIGEKMSWMAGRKTTREEDVAYCLLGIFDINMPLLYGEGSKAFERLQEEVTKQSTDHSLFAWQWPQYTTNRKGRQPNLFANSTKLFSNLNTKLLGHHPQFDVKVNEDEDPLNNILSLTNFGLSINLELIPTADPDCVFGVLNTSNVFPNPGDLPDRELWCIPLQRMGRVYLRTPFPPGPFPVTTRRKRSIHPIHIPRNKVYFSEYSYQYAFVILFPDLEIGAGFKIKSLRRIGDEPLNIHHSIVPIRRDYLKNGKIAASVLSIERSETCLVLLYVGAREVNNEVETAVRLFPAETSSVTVKNTQITFGLPSPYRDECDSFSLVASKGYCFDPLPRESSSQTIFSISLHMKQDKAKPRSKK